MRRCFARAFVAIGLKLALAERPKHFGTRSRHTGSRSNRRFPEKGQWLDACGLLLLPAWMCRARRRLGATLTTGLSIDGAIFSPILARVILLLMVIRIGRCWNRDCR